MADEKLENKEKFYQDMLSKHMKDFSFGERVKYQLKVLNRAGMISKGLKEAIYERTKTNREALRERLYDDLAEIRHNYGAAERGRGAAEHEASRDFDRDMRILEPLEEKISKMREEEYSERGAGI